ncbi:MAG TPA: hypothetical protein VHY22_07835 [Chthoniobacteraceae bacterium]|jgi:hypothetical protein|nr:hypothetical protein [Chthoniobacteraceae bacterium]
MKSYTFGYLFVRLNKALAIFTVLCGLGASGLLYLRDSFEVQSLAYVPNDTVPLRLQDLSNALDQTQSKINIGFKGTPTFQSQYSNSLDFQQLHGSLSIIGGEIHTAKTMLTKEFDDSVDTIRSKLLAHVNQLNASVAQPTPQAPSVSRPALSVNHPDQLFSQSLSKDDIDGRKAVFSTAVEFFRVLESAAEDPENKAVLSKTGSEVEGFANLLPVYVETDLDQNNSSETPETAPKKIFNAEKVAIQLGQLQSQVDEAITSSWSADDALEKATEIYTEESAKCRESEHQIRRVWRDFAVSVGESIAFAVVLAFALMVLADLTKAILDTAANGSIVASAYTIVRDDPVDYVPLDQLPPETPEEP